MATTEGRGRAALGTQYKMQTTGLQFPNRDKNREPRVKFR
jgi:hypothetical protein